MTGKRIRVMLADDSPFLCRMLSVHLVQAEGFEVVGCVHRGRSVLHKIRELRPDAVSLGLNFPDMDGLDVLAQVMTEHPVPVVVLTGTGGRFAFRIARAMDLGAVDYVLKFVPGQPIQPEDLTRKIVSKLRLAAATKVVRLRAVSNTPMPRRPATRIAQDIVVIGASTGGPAALAELCSEIPAEFAPAVLVIQHMPARFTTSLAARLDRLCGIPVSEARRGDILFGSSVKVAPGGFHLTLEPGGRIQLHAAETSGAHCPSVDMAMESAAEVFGSHTVGVLLSGMGSDGVLGLAAIRNRHGLTYVQDPESCAVAGMPGAAIEQGVAGRVARPAELGRLLAKKTRGERHVS